MHCGARWHTRITAASQSRCRQKADSQLPACVSLRQELGVELAEEGLESGGRAVGEGVNGVDKTVNARGHDEEVAGQREAGVPVSVRCAAGNEDGGAGAGFDFVFADLDAEDSFENVPGFVIAVMDVAGSDVPGRAGRAAGIAPFGDDEVVRGRPDNVAGER